MAKKKIKNPLVKRLPREFIGDWKKYLILFIFLTSIIGFVSGMFVANRSMLIAAEKGIEKYKREDGRVEFEEPVSAELKAAIESGKVADVKAFVNDKAQEELDKKFKSEFDKEFNKEFDKQFEEQVTKSAEDGAAQMGLGEDETKEFVASAIKEAKDSEDYTKAYDEAYKEAYDEAYDEAQKELKDEVDKEYKKIEDKLGLDEPADNVSVKLIPNFYADLKEDEERKVRVFKVNNDTNLASMHEGRLPQNDNEIAIDRMHADNVELSVGDKINVAGRELEITGLIALPNYQGLFETNSDIVFDSIGFNVALVTDGCFDEITKDADIHYAYSWDYPTDPTDDYENKTMSEALLKIVMSQSVVYENEVKDFLPAYLNQGVTYATSDFSKDLGMMTVFMAVFMLIIAFLFGVSISSTISKESKVIGTLRASGYSRGEMIRHYMLIPVLITVAAAVVGNILGYTVLKNVVASMYYGSYSLPVFETVWSFEALYMTTLIPFAIMLTVNLVIISYKLRFTPLEFLRNDLKKSKRKNAMRLPRWKFFERFRLRIMLRNIPNYLVMGIGLIFIMFLMAFAIGTPDTLDNVKANVADMIICEYQTILKGYEDEDGNEITTKEDAEKFAVESLRIENEKVKEDVMVYGIEGSRYINVEGLSGNNVIISKTLSDKYGFEIGDEVVLKAQFEKSEYRFVVSGFEENISNMTVFMPIEEFNAVFDRKTGEFNGFFSDKAITDIDEDMIAQVITRDDLLKSVKQLDKSIGGSMSYFQIICVILAVALTYILTKNMIEKSENSISMTKILGYDNGEIASLYIISTTFVFVVMEVVGVLLGIRFIKLAWSVILMSMSGWYDFVVEPSSMIKMILLVFAGYLIVVAMDMLRIKKVPLSEALKNVE